MHSDNVIGFDSGSTGDTSFGFQIQPVYAIDFQDAGFTMIPRGIVPIMGLEPGTDASSAWGLGDTMLQLFFAPHTESSWKWGLGPQVSIPTATRTQLEGPQWGAGVAGVLVRQFHREAGICRHHGESMGQQRQVQYPDPSAADLLHPGTRQVARVRRCHQRGLSWNQTLDMGDGHGFDYMIGPYYNVERPDGAAKWQIRFAINWLFP